MNLSRTCPAWPIGSTAAQLDFDNELAGLASEMIAYWNNPVRMVQTGDWITTANQGWTKEGLRLMHRGREKMLRGQLGIVSEEQKEVWERRRLRGEKRQNAGKDVRQPQE